MIDRYTTWVPNVFLWELGQLPHYHVYLASHFIEHIRERELLLLLKAIPQHGRFLAFSAPLPEEGPTDWAGYHGSHILEVGWDEVGRIVERHEWAPILDLWTPGFRAWRREV